MQNREIETHLELLKLSLLKNGITLARDFSLCMITQRVAEKGEQFILKPLKTLLFLERSDKVVIILKRCPAVEVFLALSTVLNFYGDRLIILSKKSEARKFTCHYFHIKSFTTYLNLIFRPSK